MKTINKNKKYIFILTISCLLGVCSSVALAEETNPSLAEQYIQQESEKETFLDKAYNTHAETITNILVNATDDLREKESNPPTESTPPVTETETESQPQETETPKYIINLSQSEIDLLAKVVYAESGNQPFEGQVAVAATVINRVYSPKFPNTLTQVLYAPNQFTVVRTNAINRTPSDTAYEAVEAAMRGQDPSNGGLYFWNPRVTKSKYFSSLTKTAEIGSHAFAK